MSRKKNYYNMANVLGPGQSLANNQFLLSNNLQFMAIMQSDGNFVVYNVQGMKPLWDTGTNGQIISNCIMQGDGNFVLYNGAGAPVFTSNTNGHSYSYLIMQDDGNLVVYTQGTPTWASNTVTSTTSKK